MNARITNSTWIYEDLNYPLWSITLMFPEHAPFSCITHLLILGLISNAIPMVSSQHSILYITPQLYPSNTPICFIPLYAKHSPIFHSQWNVSFVDALNWNFSNTVLGRVISRASSIKSLRPSNAMIFSPAIPKAFLTLLISKGARDRMAALFNIFAFSIWVAKRKMWDCNVGPRF